MASPTTAQPDRAVALRTAAGAILAPLVFVVLWVAPLPVEEPAHRLAAIFGAVLVAWVTEVVPIAVTALLIAPLLVITGVADPKPAFQSYADPLLYLFVGGFFIAEAMSAHGLDRRVAKAIIGIRWVRGLPSRVRIALLIAGALTSMWISNTAATAILLPILLGTIGSRRDRTTTGAILALAYACSVGGLGTVVGSPPNAIAIRLLDDAGVHLSFLDWMKIGVPTAIVLGIAIHFVTRAMAGGPSMPVPALDHPEGAEEGAEEDAETSSGLAAAGIDDVPDAWNRGEITTAVAFGLAVFGWLLPGIATAAGWAAAPAIDSALPEGVVALLAAALLFIVPDGRGKRVLTWRRATRIDWGVILLFGGGIALGTQLVATGLAAEVSRGFLSFTGIESLWPLTAVLCVFTIFFTEICSNTASSNMLVPLAIAMAAELHVSAAPPVLAVALAASCAFMLPIATGPNAIVYSSGHVSQATMIKIGFVLNLIAAALVFAVVRLLCPAYGWS